MKYSLCLLMESKNNFALLSVFLTLLQIKRTLLQDGEELLTTTYSVLTAECLLILKRREKRQKICDFHKLFLLKSLTFYK